ncbi:hypothetical protein [Actinomadura fibrosa]|uniref:Uncharacterized protein n=1 Tax=Actinomadura fibrosa TaxID=111802 RepID=A0ABW2XQF8_9ACTN|nr:hypothetical protein [Actinomadura fibrosa]
MAENDPASRAREARPREARTREPRTREPARDVSRARLSAARDEAVRALDLLDGARRQMALTCREAGPAPVEDCQLTEAALALAQAARELTRLVRARTREYRTDGAAAHRSAGKARRAVPDDGEPIVVLDLASRLGAGWRLCQYTSADRDAHRWHLRHDGHPAGAVTHYLDLRGERTGWEAHDARGFRLWPGPDGDAFGRSSGHLWATRAAAVRAVARAHRCP